MGGLWLGAILLFVFTAAALFVWPHWWFAIGAVAIAVSMIAILPSWADAKFGAVQLRCAGWRRVRLPGGWTGEPTVGVRAGRQPASRTLRCSRRADQRRLGTSPRTRAALSPCERRGRSTPGPKLPRRDAWPHSSRSRLAMDAFHSGAAQLLRRTRTPVLHGCVDAPGSFSGLSPVCRRFRDDAAKVAAL